MSASLSELDKARYGILSVLMADKNVRKAKTPLTAMLKKKEIYGTNLIASPTVKKWIANPFRSSQEKINEAIDKLKEEDLIATEIDHGWTYFVPTVEGKKYYERNVKDIILPMVEELSKDNPLVPIGSVETALGAVLPPQQVTGVIRELREPRDGKGMKIQ